MIRQRFTLPKYGWSCMVYYAVDTYYTEEILDSMHSIGCDGDMLRTAYDNINSGNLNTGRGNMLNHYCASANVAKMKLNT